MIFVKKLAGFAAAVLLTLSALAGSRVFADSDFVEVSVPITTEWLDPLLPDDFGADVTSKFTLTPLNNSPAPGNINLIIFGASRGTIGPIRFDSPDNFYYHFTGVLGAKKQPVDMTIRISIFIEDGELIPVVTAYDNLKDPDLGEKSELVFKIEAPMDQSGGQGNPSDKKDPPEKQEPDSKKPDGTPTPDNKGSRPADNSQNNQPGKNQGVHTGAQSYAEFWMLMGACALLAGLFLAKKGSRA